MSLNPNIIETFIDPIEVLGGELCKLGMRQVSSDIAYFVAWYKSAELTTDGSRLKPTPAGERTVDAYSSNCPIPYTVSYDSIKDCTDIKRASSLCELLGGRFTVLRMLSAREPEVVGVANQYIDYVESLKSLLYKQV